MCSGGNARHYSDVYHSVRLWKSGSNEAAYKCFMFHSDAVVVQVNLAFPRDNSVCVCVCVCVSNFCSTVTRFQCRGPWTSILYRSPCADKSPPPLSAVRIVLLGIKGGTRSLSPLVLFTKCLFIGSVLVLLEYRGWQWHNFVPYLCQLVFAAILWVNS